ncbi:MAG TPA: DUF4062 domain-containing protein [Nitrososphaeraceae archaeon]|nr:DUF4062 domain-containing protein [Nitrososphaeraceae archaeon]
MGYRIFISSTMDDLEEERNKIAIEIMRNQHIPIMAEFVFNVRNNPKETLEKEFNKCDGYIGIFHKRWGYIPKNDNPEKLSITAIEYTWAKKRNIPRFILKSKYEKDDELKNFIDKISDMQEGNWVKSYKDSNDLILQAVRGLPTLIDAIKTTPNKAEVFNKKDLSIPSLYIIDSNQYGGIKERIQDFNKEIIESYVETIKTSSKSDTKYIAWRYLDKLAASKRLWNHDKIWDLLDTEILVSAPTQFFFDATSILKWMLRNSELDSHTRNNATMSKARQNYLAKLREILGSSDSIWDSYHRTEVKQILTDITMPEERCRIWWDAWKSCAKGIEDTSKYTQLTQSISTELESSNDECKDAIRPEQMSIIENGDPLYFAQRAKELHL